MPIVQNMLALLFANYTNLCDRKPLQLSSIPELDLDDT
jgi:hypothetical protein